MSHGVFCFKSESGFSPGAIRLVKLVNQYINDHCFYVMILRTVYNRKSKCLLQKAIAKKGTLSTLEGSLVRFCLNSETDPKGI